jgi:inositol transport system permease protein
MSTQHNLATHIGAGDRKRAAMRDLANLLRNYGIVAVLIVLCLLSGVVTPNFFTADNLINVLRQVSVTTIIAFGQTLLIIAGMVDLASGSIVALTGCMAMRIYIQTQSALIAILVAVLVGAALGLVSGLIITKYGVPSFIMTLAMMTIARGATFIYTGGFPIYNIGDIAVLGKGSVLLVPIPIIVLLALFMLTAILLSKTKFGRYLYAIGGNENAAIAAGINTKRIKTRVFVLSGALAAIGGVLLMSRLNSGQPAAGVGYEFDAITAAIIGGTSFTGGVGTIWGTLAGSLIVGVLNNVMNLINVPSYYQQVLKGVIIVFAVVLDLVSKKTKPTRIVH